MVLKEGPIFHRGVGRESKSALFLIYLLRRKLTESLKDLSQFKGSTFIHSTKNEKVIRENEMENGHLILCNQEGVHNFSKHVLLMSVVRYFKKILKRKGDIRSSCLNPREWWKTGVFLPLIKTVELALLNQFIIIIRATDWGETFCMPRYSLMKSHSRRSYAFSRSTLSANHPNFPFFLIHSMQNLRCYN